MKRTTIAATLTTRPSPDGFELTSLPSEVDLLELRADLAGDVPVSWFRQHHSAPTLYSLRSRGAGGLFSGSDEQRTQRLVRAAAQFDYVELEVPRDVTASILRQIPAEQRVMSSHAPASSHRELQARFVELSATPARYYRLSCPVEHPGQAVAPLLFLKSLGRSDVIAYATGAAGVWTSVIAPNFGWPIAFGTVSDCADPREGLSVKCLIEDYGLPRLHTYRELYGIVGNMVSQSLSPRIHNAAYRSLDQPAIFVPLVVEDFAGFWQSFIAESPLSEIGLAVKGFTIASPHKETVSNTCRDKSNNVQAAQSSNLMYRRNGSWRTATTDPDGVLLNLQAHAFPPAGRTVAVVGCGGSGRAIAAALKQAGSRVTMFNRSPEHGRRAMQLLNVPFVPLSEFRADAFSVVVNATPVGRDGQSCPFDPNQLRDGAVVIDHVYGEEVTPLVEFARRRGLTTIDGRDILCTQVARQFQRMTRRPMPPGLAKELIDRSRLSSPTAFPIRADHSSAPTAQDPQCLPKS